MKLKISKIIPLSNALKNCFRSFRLGRSLFLALSTNSKSPNFFLLTWVIVLSSHPVRITSLVQSCQTSSVTQFAFTATISPEDKTCVYLKRNVRRKNNYTTSLCTNGTDNCLPICKKSSHGGYQQCALRQSPSKRPRVDVDTAKKQPEMI